MKKPITILTYILTIVAFLPLSGGRGVAAEPTLARLSFWVPPERMTEFEAAYQKHVLPILNRHGLVPSTEPGRTTVDSVFARLFAFKSPAEFEDVRDAFLSDPTFEEIQRILGTTFLPNGLIRQRFEIYTSPSGPGTQVAAGSGQGHWTTYGVAEGLLETRVRSIVQDREGALWFGTSGGGVSRYDGETFTTLTSQDGLASNDVRSICQDRDGFLWIGTAGGVSRYNGETFTTLTSQDGLASNDVRSICQDRDGFLWIGTAGGISRYDDEAFTTLTSQDGLAHDSVHAIFQDREGALWFGTSGGGVSQYDGQSFTTFSTQDGLAHRFVWSIVQDQSGALWFGTMGGVSRYDGESFTSFSRRDGLSHNQVTSIVQDQSGALWFSTLGFGVSRYNGQTFATFTTQDGLPHTVLFSSLQDREGALWFGTNGGGVSRYNGNTFTTFTTQDGLAHERVRSIIQDRDGVLWFGTTNGVSRYDGETFTAFTTQNGLASNAVHTIYQDREGFLWIGTANGVSRYDGETFATFKAQDGLVDNNTHSIYQDRDGVLWFGAAEGGVSRYDGQTFTTFTAQDAPHNRVHTIFQDREGFLWFGTSRGVSRYDGQIFTTFTAQDGLPYNRVRSIYEDRHGTLWFGTDGGVSRYDGQTFKNFTSRDGLANNSVRSIIQDREGYLWFGTDGGVSRYDGQIFTTLTTEDGLAHNSVSSLLQDRDGTLWLGTNGGGVTRYRQPVPVPPPVYIDAVVADRRYEGISDMAFPSTVALTMFEFHGISLKTRPEAMVYRYRLKGYEKDWQTTHDRRVEYENLPRGTYTFEVEAVDRDLVYSETPATVALTVHLPYEHVGLYSALGIALVLIGWQTARVIRRDRKLQASNTALEVQNIQLTEAREAANAANQAKSRFLASMSHELRTPLNGILGYAQILNRSKNMNEKEHNGISVIRRSGEHLLGLINEVLDLARIEADRVELEDKEIRLSAFLKNIVAINEVRAKDKNLTFSHKTHPDLPEVITGDPKRLRQVLDNLLSNAIKFTPEGEVSFGIGIVSKREDRVRLRFDVRDSGVGLSEEESAKVFKPFEQAGDAKQKAQGTGLGLAISQQIVELMGGEIQVESEPGKGSRFFFEADFTEVEGKGDQTAQETRLPVGFGDCTRKVLVVDDTAENRSVLIDLLEPLGFEIQEAENGEEALKLAAKNRPDLILMDLVMPELDGFEATRQIRQSDVLKGVIVIGLSASVFEEDRDQSLTAGCNDFVAKPLQASELLDKIGNHLNLEWIYEEEDSQADDKAPLIAPPSEALTALYDFAQKGQILGLKEEVEKLAEMGETYTSFVSQVKTMVNGFQLDELCDFLKPHLESETKGDSLRNSTGAQP